MPERKFPPLLRWAQLKEHGVLLSRRQVDRLEAELKFPKRVIQSNRCHTWVAAEIDAWVKQRIAARSDRS